MESVDFVCEILWLDDNIAVRVHISVKDLIAFGQTEILRCRRLAIPEYDAVIGHARTLLADIRCISAQHPAFSLKLTICIKVANPYAVAGICRACLRVKSLIKPLIIYVRIGIQLITGSLMVKGRTVT